MDFDYKKEYKEFYMPTNKSSIIEIPKMYIVARGRGNPNEENVDYNNTIGFLYGIDFTIEMSYKGTHKIEGFFEYVVLVKQNCNTSVQNFSGKLRIYSTVSLTMSL